MGQRLLFDLSFDVGDCPATVTDDVEDTIDYGDVCQYVALVASERSFKTLEALCSAIGDRLIERYGASAVSVRAAKPEPPIPLPVEEVAVEVWKEGPARRLGAAEPAAHLDEAVDGVLHRRARAGFRT